MVRSEDRTENKWKKQNNVQRQTFKDLQKGWRTIIKEHFRKVSASLEEDILIIFTHFPFFSTPDVVWIVLCIKKKNDFKITKCVFYKPFLSFGYIILLQNRLC